MTDLLRVVRPAVSLARARAAIGRVTMYRLVLTLLTGLALIAVVLSAVGALAYTATAAAASLVTALLVSYGSNRVFASALKVVPHSESSLITGLLLFFIFAPTTNPGPLLSIALAALLATASKYVLAVRGRHVLNPAAAGAFLLTLTGLDYTSWWVGNPVMLPFTLVAAAVVVYRVHKAEMALVFVVVAAGVMVTRSLLAGVDLLTAVEWPFTSSPMIFFVGLMLTEPLTRPPLRLQQLAFAALVGVLFATPMHLGIVYIAPESALLVGNALAFLVGQRRGIELVLEEKAHLTPTTVEYSFRPSRRLRFRAGQYVELTLPHAHADARGLRRVFSIASAPVDTDRIRISTKLPIRPSTFKRTLEDLPDGSVITATSVAGDFVLPRNPRTPILMVAGGIGITPFVSQIQNLPPDRRRDITVLYSVSDVAEISYRSVLEEAGVRVVVISPRRIAGLDPRWQVAPVGRIDRDVLARFVPDIAGRHVYISGPPVMAGAVGALARSLNARAVHTDAFTGY